MSQTQSPKREDEQDQLGLMERIIIWIEDQPDEEDVNTLECLQKAGFNIYGLQNQEHFIWWLKNERST